MLRSLTDDVFGSQAAGLRPGPACLGKPWDTIRELEWPMVGIPESLGGAGGDIEDVLALAEGVGRNAVNVPLLPAHSAYAVAAAGGRTDLLGQRLVVETQPRWSSLRVEEVGRQLRISGTARRTPWARHADALLIRGPEAAGSGWIACDPRDPAVMITPGLNLAGEPRDDVLFDNLVVGVESRWECADESLATRGILLGCAALVGAHRRDGRSHQQVRQRAGAVRAAADGVAGSRPGCRADALPAFRRARGGRGRPPVTDGHELPGRPR